MPSLVLKAISSIRKKRRLGINSYFSVQIHLDIGAARGKVDVLITTDL
jgi:hypothetical protein